MKLGYKRNRIKVLCLQVAFPLETGDKRKIFCICGWILRFDSAGLLRISAASNLVVNELDDASFPPLDVRFSPLLQQPTTNIHVDTPPVEMKEYGVRETW